MKKILLIITITILTFSCKKENACNGYNVNIHTNGCGYTYLGSIDGASVGELKYDPTLKTPNDNFFTLSLGAHILKWNTPNLPSDVHTVNFTVEKCKLTKVEI